MNDIAISPEEFALFQRLIRKIAGISLNDTKKDLVVGRLAKRLRHHALPSFTAYYRMLSAGAHPEELQIMVDLLTTNETYFFREPGHFAFLRDQIIPHRKNSGIFRVWSAASSTGEEAYSIAMLLAETLGEVPWEVFGSDISTRVLARAVTGHYTLERTEGIPPEYMRKYCMKGVRSQAGTFMIVPELRRRTAFRQINLLQPVDASIGEFDVVFLRNVMIYFDPPTKAEVVHNLLPRMKPGAHLLIGHSETLNGITDRVVMVHPTIYRKP